MSWNPWRARRERATRRIGAVLLALPEDRHYGWPLMRAAGYGPGAGYPVLTRMLVAGWLSDGWQDDPAIPEEKRRRYYMLTDLGHRELTALLREAMAS